MPRWRFWERQTDDVESEKVSEDVAPTVAPLARGFKPPLPRDATETRADAGDDKRARLVRRREAVLFDVEQSELAAQPENPWRERIALLNESLATVTADVAALDHMPSQPGTALPPEPIQLIRVEADAPASVNFVIVGETFRFAEEIDWAERGHQVAQPELRRVEGDISRLIPRDFSENEKSVLQEHLAASLFVFAVELRDRVLNDQPLPSGLSLADLARPCRSCGGWKDVHGLCAECQRREWQRQALLDEAERLRAEREREDAERAKIADRLPVARRRLAEVDAALSALSE